MNWRAANDEDLDLLAEWNRQLIEDEGHRNSMSVPELRRRMAAWLAGEYSAVLFSHDNGESLAYGLYREANDEIYLRQFFVRRRDRREGIGKTALATLRGRVWPKGKRLTVDVLSSNDVAIRFWRSVGYSDYFLTLAIEAEST
jgi:GNAT superfamily N-acetyltransferase